MSRIGLLGGTFDPPHIGHFIIAQEVKNQLTLDEIWFIPTYEPPHKESVLYSADDRLQMLKAAVNMVDGFAVEDLELRRKGKSYTVDTVEVLQQMYPQHSFYFIIGADMVEYLPNWHQIDKLMDSIHFVGVIRSGYTLKTPYPIMTVEVPVIDISSTMIREYLQKGLNVRYFLPHEVYLYMKEQEEHEDGQNG